MWVGEIAQESRNGKISIVWRFCAASRVVGLDWLPHLITVINSLMHVPSADALGDESKTVVETPQRGAEGIGNAGDTLAGEGIAFAEDEGGVGNEFLIGDGVDGGFDSEEGVDGVDVGGVVHEGALKRESWLAASSDVSVEDCWLVLDDRAMSVFRYCYNSLMSRNIAHDSILIQSICKRQRSAEIAQRRRTRQRRCEELECLRRGHIRTGLLHICANLSCIFNPFGFVLRLVPARTPYRSAGQGQIIEIRFIAEFPAVELPAQSTTRIWDRSEHCFAACGGVVCEIETVTEADTGPCLIALEEGRANSLIGRIVWICGSKVLDSSHLL